MTDPINLNKARKERALKERRRQADENAVKFGRSKAEKARDEAQARRTSKNLEAHRLKTDEEK